MLLFMALDVSGKHQSAARTSGPGTVIVIQVTNVFAQNAAAESDTLTKRIPTPCYEHTLNTLRVSFYQNYTITIPLNAAAKYYKFPYITMGHALAGWKILCHIMSAHSL
jgi:hypothetical protein